MASIINRVKTIVGEDASFFQAFCRLLFYTYSSKIWLKPFKEGTQSKPIHPNGMIQKISNGSATPLVSIIIPTKNKADFVSRCVSSIFEKSTYTNIEILLIDNQSTEDSLAVFVSKMQQEKGDRFKRIEANFVFNFSALMNCGAREAKGDFLVLLNNDTEIITPDWIERMLDYASHPQAGAIGCKLVYPNGTIQHAGVEVYRDGTVTHYLSGVNKNDVLVNQSLPFAAITAAAMMVKKETYNRVGGFDEAFAVEFNDIAFCLRLQQAGYSNIYIHDVEIVHYESASRRHPFSDPRNYKRYKNERELFRTLLKTI